MQLNDKETATVIAALRFMQAAADIRGSWEFKLRLSEMMPEHFGFSTNHPIEPLDSEELDALCEQLKDAVAI